MTTYLFRIGILLLLGTQHCYAQSQDTPKQQTASSVESIIPTPTIFMSKHKGRFNGVNISYKAIAGETYLTDIKDKPKASIFSFSYIKNSVKDPATRPVTFIWNGGPGSASTWLHMGGYGPKRIVVPSNAKHPGLPPYQLVDAPETILDVSDLVFIDPVGTGYSRALGAHEGKEFWGLYEDAQSMAEFIKTWMTKNKRWNSPRFIIGESYGTTRAAAVANILEADMGISLNGIIFVSQALDYQGSTPYIRDNLIAHITYLPTMAATALYHGKINPKPSSQLDFLQQAREFASNELMPALFKGSAISTQEFNHIRDKLAYFTGLDKHYIEQSNLRIQGFRFAKQLLRDKGLTVGLLDGRYTREEIDNLDADVAGDAAAQAIDAAYKAALMMHMQHNLKVDWQRHYLSPADPELNANWRYRTAPDGQNWEPAFVNTARDLSAALRTNPGLKVLVASGYFDLVTPFFDAEYTLGRHDIPKERLQFEYYQGGHMMYVNDDARIQLLDDTRSFIKQQTK